MADEDHRQAVYELHYIWHVPASAIDRECALAAGTAERIIAKSWGLDEKIIWKIIKKGK